MHDARSALVPRRERSARLLGGRGPSKLSAITSNLLSERMLSSKNDSIVPLSVWKNIYGNTNCHLAIRACNIRETSKRTLDLYFLFFPAQYVEIIVCVPFGTIAWSNDVLSAAKEASSRRVPSRFKMCAQSTFRRWCHRPFYTLPKAGGSHVSWKLRIRSVCV